MADFATVRAGLRANLETIAELAGRVHETAPETIQAPAVVITPADGVFLEFDTSMDGDSDDLAFVLHLFVPRRLDQVGQAELDGYLARSGARSIRAAVASADVAGTQFAEVLDARDYGDYTYAGESLLGCKFSVFIGAV